MDLCFGIGGLAVDSSQALFQESLRNLHVFWASSVVEMPLKLVLEASWCIYAQLSAWWLAQNWMLDGNGTRWPHRSSLSPSQHILLTLFDGLSLTTGRIRELGGRSKLLTRVLSSSQSAVHGRFESLGSLGPLPSFKQTRLTVVKITENPWALPNCKEILTCTVEN